VCTFASVWAGGTSVSPGYLLAHGTPVYRSWQPTDRESDDSRGLQSLQVSLSLPSSVPAHYHLLSQRPLQQLLDSVHYALSKQEAFLLLHAYKEIVCRILW
jgi:hypothetical protein